MAEQEIAFFNIYTYSCALTCFYLYCTDYIIYSGNPVKFKFQNDDLEQSKEKYTESLNKLMQDTDLYKFFVNELVETLLDEEQERNEIKYVLFYLRDKKYNELSKTFNEGDYRSNTIAYIMEGFEEFFKKNKTSIPFVELSQDSFESDQKPLGTTANIRGSNRISFDHDALRTKRLIRYDRDAGDFRSSFDDSINPILLPNNDGSIFRGQMYEEPDKDLSNTEEFLYSSDSENSLDLLDFEEITNDSTDSEVDVEELNNSDEEDSDNELDFEEIIDEFEEEQEEQEKERDSKKEKFEVESDVEEEESSDDDSEEEYLSDDDFEEEESSDDDVEEQEKERDSKKEKFEVESDVEEEELSDDEQEAESSETDVEEEELSDDEQEAESSESDVEEEELSDDEQEEELSDDKQEAELSDDEQEEELSDDKQEAESSDDDSEEEYLSDDDSEEEYLSDDEKQDFGTGASAAADNAVIKVVDHPDGALEQLDAPDQQWSTSPPAVEPSSSGAIWSYSREGNESDEDDSSYLPLFDQSLKAESIDGNSTCTETILNDVDEFLKEDLNPKQSTGELRMIDDRITRMLEDEVNYT